MAESVLRQRLDALRRLARRGAIGPLAKAVAKMRAEDLAAAMAHMSAAEQRLVFAQIRPDHTAAEVLTRVEGEDFQHLVQDLSVERLLVLVNEMEADDRTDILEHLPEDKREGVLARLHKEERAEVEELLGYRPDSAGGIMLPYAFRLREDVTCRDAIAAVQEEADHELIYYLYVENESEQLAGVVSLRALLTHAPSTRLNAIMTTDLIVVSPETDQEEVARIAGRYSLLAVPVVDEQRKLLGIVTVDDVIDVIREEAAEDMLLMAGVSEEAADPVKSGRLAAAWRRFPWLLVTLLGGVGISELVTRFSGTIQSDVVLAAFMPMITGMGGNVGVQSATIAVRNLATGQGEGGTWKSVLREVVVGNVLGVVFSLLIAGYCMLRYGAPLVALCVGGALLAAITAAAMVGTAVPLTLRRIGVDPAIATGPFVTTAIDGLGLTLYLGIATLLMNNL